MTQNIEIGDLVKYKWSTFAARRRANLQGTNINAVGVVLEVLKFECENDDYTQLLVQFAGEKKPRRCTQSNVIVVK
jgi:hypothetical protein